MGITASEIAQLRAKTGASMMDCKNALEEAAGNMDQAIDILRKKVLPKQQNADKITAEGLVYSYIHGEGRIGVLLELNCETDFVAKTDQFKNLANDIAMHIAATNPKYLSKEDVNIEEIEREKDIYRAQLKNEGKPEEMIEKILEGKMSRYYTEVCLLEQAFIKDEEKTIIQLLNEKTGEIGEKISLRRFVRFELGEGIEKVCKDFAEEVREQMEV